MTGLQIIALWAFAIIGAAFITYIGYKYVTRMKPHKDAGKRCPLCQEDYLVESLDYPGEVYCYSFLCDYRTKK